MKINGYMLREAIKRQVLRRDTSAALFNDSLKAFPGEQKQTPDDIMRAFAVADGAIAALQVAQAQYNLAVLVAIRSAAVPVPLSYAVKLLGGYGRADKMWRSAAAPERDPWHHRDQERDSTKQYAALVLSREDLMTRAVAAGRAVGSLREAIASANAQMVDIDLDPSLFD